MTELELDFNALPVEYQKVLNLAQEKHNIRVTPLQELKGGQTGANLFLVSVSSVLSGQVQHLVLKLDHLNKKTKMDELERHRSAVDRAPADFAGNHIADLAYDRIELENSVAIFYNVAGQSLHNYRPLSSYQQLNKLDKIFRKTYEILLAEWNLTPSFKQAVLPREILASWLGYRLKPGGNIERFMEDICHFPPDTAGLLIQDNVFPNPYLYARNIKWPGNVRPIDIITGFQHGDLNIGNILAKFNVNEEDLTGYYLIDFALFKSDMPLFYDNCYLEMSYLIRELSRTTFPKWIDFVSRFAVQDIIDPQYVPIELAGACNVINSGRKVFGDWVHKFHSSLSDDLWGQFWLAAVGAGLNYCNKTIISDRERLAGLIFAAVHLKRFHAAFGVPLPTEVKHINLLAPTEAISQDGEPAKVKTIPTVNNLPAMITPFIGRKKEIKRILELMQREDVRLATLTGPGGTGKTRLGLQTAANLIDSFVDGVFFIDLSPVSEPESLFTTIARTIGLRKLGDGSAFDDLRTHLQDRKILLLLDNFEQLTSASPKVGELLRDCPHLKLLVTSREPLHLRGEQIIPVPPLALPGADALKQSIEQMTECESVKLFIERALTVRPDFKVTNENISVIAEICSRLDGLPLAIELAAARINLLSPDALLKRMKSRLKVLKGGARDLPIRQQTLWDTIAWSYDLLNPEEQRLFALLSVFPDCTFDDFETIADGIRQLDEMQTDVLDGLSSLIDKSLIRRTDLNNGKPRLMMLETIREFASEKLEETPEFSTTAFTIHALHYAEFSKIQLKRLNGNEREAALSEIESEIGNLRSAWKYWVGKDDFGQLQKLIDCLWILYDARGWYHDTVNLTNDLLSVLSSTPSSPDRAQQEIMLRMSLARVLMTIKGCTPEVEDAYMQALELCQKYGEIPRSIPVLRALASFYVYTGNFVRGAQLGEQILNLAESTDNFNMRIEGHLVYGYSLIFSGNLGKGMEHLEICRNDYKPDIHGVHKFHVGNNPGVVSNTASALCLWMLGFSDRSLKLANEAIGISNKLNHPYSVAYAQFHTGLLHLWRREYENALKNADVVLELSGKHEFRIWKAVATCVRGAAFAGMGQTEYGLAEIGNGIDMYTELKTPPVFWPLLLSLRADSFIKAGEPLKGLALIEEAFRIVGEDEGNPTVSEFYKLKGDALFMISGEKIDEAEVFLQKAYDIARKQKTIIYELRALLSLFRLWQLKGTVNQNRRILLETYEKFTEGFALPDLADAGNFLKELS